MHGGGALPALLQHDQDRTSRANTIALTLLRQYDTVYLEDLRIANMVRNPHRSKRISDAGWAAVRTILEARAACVGRHVIAAPPTSTSQECSGCGERVVKRLAVRTPICSSCGVVLDRDEHAALTILRAGQAPYPEALTWPAGASVA